MEQKKKRAISIRTKLIAVIIPIVLVMIAAFFGLSRNVILKLSEERLIADAEVHANEINVWTERIFSELQIYQNTIEKAGFENDDEILEYMKTSLNKNESYPVGLYMGDDSGVYLDASGWVPEDDWILTERDWYIDGKDNEELAFGEPYYDSQTGQVCVSAAVRMDYEKATRVMAVDVYLDYVCGLVSEISAQNRGEAFLVTKDSKIIIAHPDMDMMAVTLDTAGLDKLYKGISGVLTMDNGDIIELSGDEGKYFACLNPVANTDWMLVTYMAQKDVLSELHRIEIIMALIAVVAALVLVFATLSIMNRIVKPVAVVTDMISRIADGDFSQNLEVKGNDEIAGMSRNMQAFITQMRSTISDISSTAEWLNKQSHDNKMVSDALIDSSKNQSEAMEVLEEMVGQISAAAEQTFEQMEKLAELIRNAQTEGTLADGLMKESVDMSDKGRNGMRRISMGMDDISDSIAALSEQITKVGDATAQIGNMVNLIMDIAEETNLLSLNASIEAASAGEAGRGFAVVAEQIGKLASNSATAADDIARLTDEIRSTVNEAIGQMKESVTAVEENAGIVSEAGDTFEELYKKVDETSHRVKQMMEMIERVNTVSSQMEGITGRQVEAVEQITSSTDELGQYTKSLTENSQTVAENANELKNESVELMDRMSLFRL